MSQIKLGWLYRVQGQYETVEKEEPHESDQTIVFLVVF